MKELFNEDYNLSAINEQHVACVLLLDTSSSMEGDPINNLNEAVRRFFEDTKLDEHTQKRIDVAIVEFNDIARVVSDFAPLSSMEPPCLSAEGCTSLGAGLDLALDLVNERKELYKEIGTPYYRPWIFTITDGLPTDDYLPAVKRLRLQEEKKGVKSWVLGIPGYSREMMTTIAPRVLEARNANFNEIFEWLSNSLVISSNSHPSENPPLSDLPEEYRAVPSDW